MILSAIRTLTYRLRLSHKSWFKPDDQKLNYSKVASSLVEFVNFFSSQCFSLGKEKKLFFDFCRLDVFLALFHQVLHCFCKVQSRNATKNLHWPFHSSTLACWPLLQPIVCVCTRKLIVLDKKFTCQFCQSDYFNCACAKISLCPTSPGKLRPWIRIVHFTNAFFSAFVYRICVYVWVCMCIIPCIHIRVCVQLQWERQAGVDVSVHTVYKGGDQQTGMSQWFQLHTRRPGR